MKELKTRGKLLVQDSITTLNVEIKMTNEKINGLQKIIDQLEDYKNEFYERCTEEYTYPHIKHIHAVSPFFVFTFIYSSLCS